MDAFLVQALRGINFGCVSPYQDAGCYIAAVIKQRAVSAVTTFALDNTVPVTLDMMPGSNYVNFLNAQTEPFQRISVENHADQRWLLERLIGDAYADPDAWNGGRNWARYTGYVYNGFRAYGYLAPILGYFQQGLFCAKVGVGMNAVDDFWARMTTGQREGSDGIVQNSSQVYPNAMRRYIVDGSDSHLGEVGSDKVKDRIKLSLQSEFAAAIHP